MKKSDLEKMDILSKENKNIRASYTMVSANKVKQGGHVTMGVDENTLLELVLNPEKYYTALYIVERSQFDAL